MLTACLAWKVSSVLTQAHCQYANTAAAASAGARSTVYAATDPGAFTAAAANGGYLDCSAQPVQPHHLAADPQLAAWLWQWSSQQVQLPAAWDLPAGAAPPAGQQQ
jgi:hypothetical protein